EGDLTHHRRWRCEDGRLGFRRQGGEPLQALGYALARHNVIGVPVKLHPDNGDARRRRRPHTTHTGHTVDRSLDGERNQPLHLFGGHARRLRHDRHARRREIREHVHRHLRRPDYAKNGQKGCGREDKPPPPQRETQEEVAHQCTCPWAGAAPARAERRMTLAPRVTTRSFALTPLSMPTRAPDRGPTRTVRSSKASPSTWT